MKKKFLLLLIPVFLFICLFFVSKPEKVSYNVLSERQAYELFKTLEKNTYIILDVRTESEYEDYHINGAINIPLDEIEEKAPEILTDKDEPIYVYCRSGNRSVTASIKLVKMGYTNINEFGGIIYYPTE